MEGASRLKGIPGIMVQGRYDMLCPPKTAYKLAQHWPDAELRIVPCSGHAVSETKIKTELIKALDDLTHQVL